MAKDDFSYSVTTKTGEKITRTISRSSKGRTRTIKDSSGRTITDYGKGFRETTTPAPQPEIVEKQPGLTSEEVVSRERPEVIQQLQKQQSTATPEELRRVQNANRLTNLRSSNNNTRNAIRETIIKARDRREERRARIQPKVERVQETFNIPEPRGNVITDILSRSRGNIPLRSPVIRSTAGRVTGNIAASPYQIVPTVVETGENIVLAGKVFREVPSERENLRSLSREGVRTAGSNIVSAVTDPATYVEAGLGISAAGKGGRFVSRVSDVSRSRGRTFVEPETVFDRQVLKNLETGEGTPFPLAKDITTLEREFGSGKTTKVVTASPQPLEKTNGVVIIREGPAGARDLEDTGAYVSPMPRGSVYFTKVFTGVTRERVVPGFQLFPKVTRPTASVVTTKVERLPSNIINTNDQALINAFERANPGRTFITSNVERAFNPKLKGRTTREAEGVMTPGTVLEPTGSKEFTRVNNRVVAIEEFKIKKGGAGKVLDDTVPRNTKTPSTSSSRTGTTTSIGTSSISTSFIRVSQSRSGSASSNATGKAAFSSSAAPSYSPVSPGFTGGGVSQTKTGFSRSFGLSSSSTPPPPIYRTPSSSIRTPSTPGRPIYTPSRPPGTSITIPQTPTRLFDTGRSRGSSFTVQTLQKGVFRTVGVASSKELAVGLGKKAVGGTALRTFRVLKGGRVQKVDAGGLYRRSKTRTGGVVERSKIAINTAGELKEISPKRKIKLGGFKI